MLLLPEGVEEVVMSIQVLAEVVVELEVILLVPEFQLHLEHQVLSQ
jgi:hypothetical protein